MKKLFFNCLILLFFVCHQGIAQGDTIRHRVFLIGDAGELDGGSHPIIEWLKKNVNWDDQKNTAVFLGDNIYPLGLPAQGEDSYDEAKKIIDYQMGLVKGKKAKAYFIMGNHDWKNGKISGWQQAVNQVDYINSQLDSSLVAEPRAGCPGPVAIQLDSLVVLTLMDSQWFLHTHDKTGPSSTCTAKTSDDFESELKEIVESHKNQLLILAMHHPIHTIGVHGGVTYKLRHHIFPLAEAVPGLYIPLPGIGSIYPLARGLFGNIQDVNHPLYRTMANMIDDVLHEHPNTIVASGHDHSLQLLADKHKNDSVLRMVQIVSGSGAKTTALSDKVRHNKLTIHAELNYGFSVVEVTTNGKVHTKFYNIQSKDYSTPSFAKEVFTIKKSEEAPAVVIDTTRSLPDSITVVANADLKGSGMKHLLLGRNYRKEWTQSVTVPVLDLGEEEGGLRPTRSGGGKQTRSLRLEDKNGKQWALRSIEKFPEAAIPADLRKTVVKDIVEQGVSASYPYASLSLQPMAKAAGIPNIRRKLVWVPADPRLLRFREEFDSTLAVLEELEPENVKKTDDTDELIIKLAKDNDDHVDQKAVLKARLLDNFIMDFDRHEGQWRWATRDTGKGKIYYPIPRDHDQMFFVNQGLFPYFARKPWIVPEIQGFRASTDNIETFNKPARNFDRFFLTELDEDVWRNHIDTFLTAMTDEVIERSLHLQPTEVQQYSMNKVINTLKNKKKYFRNNMMDYYRRSFF